MNATVIDLFGGTLSIALATMQWGIKVVISEKDQDCVKLAQGRLLKVARRITNKSKQKLVDNTNLRRPDASEKKGSSSDADDEMNEHLYKDMLSRRDLRKVGDGTGVANTALDIHQRCEALGLEIKDARAFYSGKKLPRPGEGLFATQDIQAGAVIAVMLILQPPTNVLHSHMHTPNHANYHCDDNYPSSTCTLLTFLSLGCQWHLGQVEFS